MAKTRDLEAVIAQNESVVDAVHDIVRNFGFEMNPGQHTKDKDNEYQDVSIDNNNEVTIAFEFVSLGNQRRNLLMKAIENSGFKREPASGADMAFNLGDDNYEARLDVLRQKADQYAIDSALGELKEKVDFTAPDRRGMLQAAVEKLGVDVLDVTTVADAANFQQSAAVIEKS